MTPHVHCTVASTPSLVKRVDNQSSFFDASLSPPQLPHTIASKPLA
eukprot:COSAG06_NODE_3177_length_5730_cov_98.321080_2_plen_46_part_00